MAGLDSFVGTFMSKNMSARERIAEAVLAWPGVEQASHRFGGIEFRLGRRELGHLHGDALVDLPFPRRVRDELVAQGRARPHHVLPDSGWVSFWIESPDDVEQAIWLLRLAYERALAARARAEAA
jgi:luciferase-like monooxygenase